MTYGPAAGREKKSTYETVAGQEKNNFWAGRRPGKKSTYQPAAGPEKNNFWAGRRPRINPLLGRPQAGNKSRRYGAVQGDTGRYGAVRVCACTPFKFLLGRYAGPVEQEQEQQQQERYFLPFGP